MNDVNDVKGFVKAVGQKLVNGEGYEILLRGVGFGGWLLPEGYMWCLPGQGDRPRRIEKMIEALIGKEKAKQFWDTYFEQYTSESDIRKIAAVGFNSVRIPFNTRHLLAESEPICFNEAHIHYIDQVISWCKKYDLYVILDMHGAPGGQTGANIDDSENDQPELFTKEYNRQLTIDTWRMLAERYKDEWIIAGYDLLNEPLPEWFSMYNNQVMPLYKDIVKAIREVDQNHMIILEGAHWATDWSIFNEKLDTNLMLQFHKYWNNPDTESIQVFLDKRDEWNVPIFMGEGGENNKEWLTGAFYLYEDHYISWNFWTWKKMNRSNSPCSIRMPEHWDKLVNYLEGGAKPDKETASNILEEFLNDLPIQMCDYNADVVNALFRRPSVRIPAIFYGYKGNGISFGASKRNDTQMEFRKSDGMDIRFENNAIVKPNFQHTSGEPWKPDEWMYVHLAGQEWVSYEVNVDSKSKSLIFIVNLCAKATSNEGLFSVVIDDEPAGTIIVDNLSWEIISLKAELRPVPGPHRLVIKAAEGSVGLQWLEIIPCDEKC